MMENSSMPFSRIIIALIIVSAAPTPVFSGESVCYGTAQSGRLENGVQLPIGGRNFSSYSAAGWLAGRMYLHSQVAEVLLSTFRELETSAHDKLFVVGETGPALGGRFPPHRTHQNGTSVDFMVPVLLDGKSVSLPTSLTNQFGYGIEFDDRGQWQSYQIDFHAMAEHLYQLDVQSKANGLGIVRVILEVPLQKYLWKTARGPYLRQNITFSTRQAWVRHDEHYHVDFRVKCKAQKF